MHYALCFLYVLIILTLLSQQNLAWLDWPTLCRKKVPNTTSFATLSHQLLGQEWQRTSCHQVGIPLSVLHNVIYNVVCLWFIVMMGKGWKLEIRFLVRESLQERKFFESNAVYDLSLSLSLSFYPSLQRWRHWCQWRMLLPLWLTSATRALRRMAPSLRQLEDGWPKLKCSREKVWSWRNHTLWKMVRHWANNNCG